MKQKNFILLSAIVLVVSACSNQEDVISSLPATETTTNSISWSIQPITGMMGESEGRGLIDNSTQLETVCASTTGEGIGIWGDYEVMTNQGLNTIEGFMSDVKLVYYGTGTNEDSPTGWDYQTEDQYWELGGKYRFRAYYPQKALYEKDPTAILPTSNATTYMINYRTALLQEDLLVAYQSINTMQWNLSDAVPIRLNHALTGIRFQFQMEEGLVETDYLTSCWLQNEATRDFCSVGVLAYGTYEGNEYNPNWMDWRESYNPPVTERMYHWVSTDGVEFKRTSTTNQLATAYTGSSATQGEIYTHNDGYILIIPQNSDGTVQLCFTTFEGGETIYKVPIPTKTGTSLAKQRSNDKHYDKYGNLVNGYQDNGYIIRGDARDPNGTDFVPGYLYTYTVTITKTQLGITLSVKPWNELKSSFDISF